jgi:hypothetical protein
MPKNPLFRTSDESLLLEDDIPVDEFGDPVAAPRPVHNPAVPASPEQHAVIEAHIRRLMKDS